MLLTLAWNQWVMAVLMVLFLLICGLVILTVLVQRPQGGGLAGAFGGGSGSGQTAFGTKTGDALTVLTISMFVVYLLAAIALNYGTKANANPKPPAVQSTETPATGDQPAGTPPQAPSSSPQVPAGSPAPSGTTGTPEAAKPADVTPAPSTTPANPSSGPAPATTPEAPKTDPATAPK